MKSSLAIGALLVVLTPLCSPAQERARTVLQVQKPSSSAQLLAAARVLYISPAGAGFDAAKLEAQLVGLKKFHQLGLSLTRDPSSADAIVEVTSSDTGVTLTYTVVDVRTQTVIGGGKESAIFGLAPKMVAKDLVGKIEKARKRS